MTRYEQAVEGLSVAVAGGVVVVDDGQTEWSCSEAAWVTARTRLEMQAPISDEDDGTAAGQAYGQLCTLARACDGACGVVE